MEASLRAMVLHAPKTPLVLEERVVSPLGAGEVRLVVRANAVCRTDLHVVDGDLPLPRLPLVPGHQVVGIVEAVGAGVRDVREGDRVGVPWLGWTCGTCGYCASGRENLCDQARFTGYHVDGGYAEALVADARYVFALPQGYGDLDAAPLLCAGLIGWRALRLAGEGRRLGFYGFGAAAHILCQVAAWQGREVYAFTRRGDDAAQAHARSLGAVWAGPSDEPSPEPLDAALIFAPVGALVPAALRSTAKGGVVVCAGIHMSDVPSFPYRLLWEERAIRSVANLTRRDAIEFIDLAPRVPVRTEVAVYPLADANRALDDLRAGRLTGSAVLDPRA